MMMTIMIVLRKQLAHITRGRRQRPLYLLAKTQSILRKIRFPERQLGRVPISPYRLPTTSPPFVMD